MYPNFNRIRSSINICGVNPDSLSLQRQEDGGLMFFERIDLVIDFDAHKAGSWFDLDAPVQ